MDHFWIGFAVAAVVIIGAQVLWHQLFKDFEG